MNAPKHIDCKLASVGQFYRIAGTHKYKCKPCGEIRESSSFKPIEFEWRDNPKAWNKYVETLK